MRKVAVKKRMRWKRTKRRKRNRRRNRVLRKGVRGVQ